MYTYICAYMNTPDISTNIISIQIARLKSPGKCPMGMGAMPPCDRATALSIIVIVVLLVVWSLVFLVIVSIASMIGSICSIVCIISIISSRIAQPCRPASARVAHEYAQHPY